MCPVWSIIKLFVRNDCKILWKTQNHCVSGLWPSFGIVITRKHNISKIESVSVFGWWGGKPTRLDPLITGLRLAPSNGPKTVCISLPWPEDRNRSSFRNVVFSNIRNSGRWTKSGDPVILCCYETSSNPLESTTKGLRLDTRFERMSSQMWGRNAKYLMVMLSGKQFCNISSGPIIAVGRNPLLATKTSLIVKRSCVCTAARIIIQVLVRGPVTLGPHIHIDFCEIFMFLAGPVTSDSANETVSIPQFVLVCYICHLSHRPWFYCPINIWGVRW
jgi:hypothetical protein